MAKQRNTISKGEWKNEIVQFHANRLVVTLVDHKNIAGAEERKSAIERIVKQFEGITIARSNKRQTRFVLFVPDHINIPVLAKQIQIMAEVESAEPDFIGTICIAPNDSRYSEQYNLAKVNAEAAWDLTLGDTSVIIGVLDTGIAIQSNALSHPDLDDTSRVIFGHNYIMDNDIPEDDQSHGTHCAGIAAAEGNNSEGISGINRGCQLYICKVADSIGYASQSDAADAVEEFTDYVVANNLHGILSMSLRWTTETTALRDAIQYSADNNILSCIATGNDNSVVGFPARLSVSVDTVMAVGGTDSADERYTRSNFGPEVSVVAPAVGILSTYPNYDIGASFEDYGLKTGTSMATPLVAGLGGLIWSQVPVLKASQVKNVIMHTAHPLGGSDFNNNFGHGRIEAGDAVAKAGWITTRVQTDLHFIDIPEGEIQLRAIRIDVNSFHSTSLTLITPPGAPFTVHNGIATDTIEASDNFETPRSLFIWIRYQGTTDGDTAMSTARVRCIETGDEFDVTLQANTIARPSCAMVLVLDKSGSMSLTSGVGDFTREEILKQSVNTLLSTVHEGNGVGMVTFDHDAYPLLDPIAGPMGALGDAFDLERVKPFTAMLGYPAPSGNTGIGDGIALGHDLLETGTTYDKRALIVFTDGHETAGRYITDVQELINEQVFAVGLGTAGELYPAALNEICNGHAGYLLLTDQLDNDNQFKLAKYFLQIQAGINNEDIVLDPSGYVHQGSTVKIPFYLNESDITADVFTLTPMREILHMALETPQGDIINDTNINDFPGIKKVHGEQVSFFRMSLPVENGKDITGHTGKWNLILQVNDRYFKKYLSGINKNKEAYTRAVTQGVSYTALIHAYSNLRMRVAVAQHGYEPGAIISLNCYLTEYGVPLTKSASVRATILQPDGSKFEASLHKTDIGVYNFQMTGNMSGIYTFVVHAEGLTTRNNKYTREQVATAVTYHGGNQPFPSSTNDPNNTNDTKEALCKLLHCLKNNMNEQYKDQLLKQGFDIEGLTKCYCPMPTKKIPFNRDTQNMVIKK